jgi:hypothetical protein
MIALNRLEQVGAPKGPVRWLQGNSDVGQEILQVKPTARLPSATPGLPYDLEDISQVTTGLPYDILLVEGVLYQARNSLR